MFKKALTAAAALTRRVSQPAISEPAGLKGELTMTKNADTVVEETMLDDAALDKVVGGVAHTGGRFQLDVGGHNVGFYR